MSSKLQLLCQRGLIVAAIPCYASLAYSADASVRSLDPKSYHLGTAGNPEWEEYASSTPHGRQFELRFDAEPNPTEWTLRFHQRDVKDRWDVKLNGQTLTRLARMELPQIAAIAIPPGLLKPSGNRLTIGPAKAVDDIFVSNFQLDPRPLATTLSEAHLECVVTDAATGKGIPCRLTITDISGALVPMQSAQPNVTVRTGVAYSGDGRARLGLAAGEYIIYAGRGFEYSVETQRITVRRGETADVQLAIRHEVLTPGLVSCDTHIHTGAISGHGDSSLAERMLTIAGEGVEVAVSTDHNHPTDYTESVRQLDLQSRFTPIIGNEVSSKVGHFNAFPVPVGGPQPDHKLTQWPELLQSIRRTTGARVITLNHPRDLHSDFTPFGAKNFNSVVGEVFPSPLFDCDALEVVTSAALQSDMLQLYRDWFALLNYGLRIGAVGASDTHDISRMIVGQARTYVACDDREPGHIDVASFCEAFKAGRLWVSMGLLVDMRVDDRHRVGDLVKPASDEIRVKVTVQGPSWTTADRIELYQNGVKIRELAVKPSKSVEKAQVEWKLPRPRHDAHLVVVASGPGVTAPYWEIPRPFQPTSKVRNRLVIGSTNPIWIDGDGDGKFTAARTYARKIVAPGVKPDAMLVQLAAFDESVSTQAASLYASSGSDLKAPPFIQALHSAPAHVRRGFTSFAESRAKAAP